MSKTADFLVEIHTEELPPKALRKLAENFYEEIKRRLIEAQLTFEAAQFFATPRRLAVKVNKLVAKQADKSMERKGPAYQLAYDNKGNPTAACAGFARSYGVAPDQLTTLETKQGKWVVYQQYVVGKSAEELLPEIVKQALSALPILKRMRWGENSAEFVRPVHSVILLYGKNIIPAEILGCQAGNITYGHRFYCTKPLKITTPEKYADILKREGYVIADFAQRKNKIREEAIAIIQPKSGGAAKTKISEDLLDEVTGLVEWPVAMVGTFDPSFLKVPQEVLISSMQDHQRYFPVVDAQNKLLPYFVAISNIESREVAQVIEGNERVLRARLSDAAFFYETDKKVRLDDRLQKLKKMVFQAKLGTLYEKAERLSQLADFLASHFNLNSIQAKRAGLLCKADLTTELVSEFPELQGIAGYYYALQEGEDPAIAMAIQEHYQPRFSGDELPKSMLGCCVALADRVDTLSGIFSIGLLPTGDKDPFGLRRSALGILRIVIERELNLDLQTLIEQALMRYAVPSAECPTLRHIWNFMLERLKYWYQDQGVSADVFAAVTALDLTQPYDIHRRIQAVRNFKNLPEAEALSIANKRVSNILTQYGKEIQSRDIDARLFEYEVERELAESIKQHAEEVAVLAQAGNYQQVLALLAKLREPVDGFFDHVMVMAEDPAKRENRLLMLKKLRELFLQVADIALLQ
jgi:glycyl-tRNA synthetase beta chain